MPKHKGLTLDTLLWWIRKESDTFRLDPGAEDDDFALTVVNNGQKKTFMGSMPNVLASGYDFIADDTEQYHSRVRDFFATVTAGIVDNSLQQIAEDTLEQESSSC